VGDTLARDGEMDEARVATPVLGVIPWPRLFAHAGRFACLLASRRFSVTRHMPSVALVERKILDPASAKVVFEQSMKPHPRSSPR
jgi:hypothetical protein